jgi:hypothetical protein
MTGPQVPRRDTSLRRSREELSIAAYMVGVLLCNQRVRYGLTQDDLSDELRIPQPEISFIENGTVSERTTDAQIDRLFSRLGLDDATGHSSFLKWWRDNAADL